MGLAAGPTLVAPVLATPFRRSQRLPRGGDPGGFPADLGPGRSAPGIPRPGILPGIGGMLGADRNPRVLLVDDEALGMGRGDGLLRGRDRSRKEGLGSVIHRAQRRSAGSFGQSCVAESCPDVGLSRAALP
jgi:hypothetical protein